MNNPRGDLVITMTYVDSGILAVAVALRFLARWRSKADFAADDWWILGSLIPSYGMLISGAMMVKKGGAGNHMATLTEGQMVAFLKTLLSTLVMYTSTMAAVRISILLLYRRIFRTPNFERMCWLMGALTACWWFVFVTVNIFQCHPVNAAWNPTSMFSPQCIDFQKFWYALSGSNVILDFIVLAMPIYMVWHLKLRMSQKVMLSGIFLLGCLSCVAGILRIATLGEFRKIDVTYSFATPYIWAQVEPSTAVICACLTTCRPLFKGLNFSFFGNSRQTRSHDKNGSGHNKHTGSGGHFWPQSRRDGGMFDHDLESLNRKASKGDVQVIDLGYGQVVPFNQGRSRKEEFSRASDVRKHDSFV